MFEGLVILAIMFLELLGVMAIGLLIQGLVYQLTGFSIYKKLIKVLFKEVI